MNYQLSEDVNLIVVLLNNVEELIVLSNDRKNARAVLEAIEIYSKGTNIQIPINKILDLKKMLIDSPPPKISNVIKNISKEIVTLNRPAKKSDKKNKKM